MIAAFDVFYRDGMAWVAAVAFERFDSSVPTAEYRDVVPIDSAYVAGEFYRRELPPIVHLIERYRIEPEIAVIDGYALLDGIERPGLGAHLYDYFEGKVPVVGVAKRRFAGLPEGYEVRRGGSGRPLYVTAIGMDTEWAKEAVRLMAGNHRIPTMLKRVDGLSRRIYEEKRFS
ncbi:endonuclease V [Hydrogenimonas sp.]